MQLYCNCCSAKFGLDFWVLSPQFIRFGLDAENLRIKSSLIYDMHQMKSGFALNSGFVETLMKNFEDQDCKELMDHRAVHSMGQMLGGSTEL